MMQFKNGPTRTRLNEVLCYQPEVGLFYWLPKSGFGREPNRWNAKHAGMVAGGLNAGGYRDIRIDGVMLKAHRLAWLFMTGEWPSVQIDHIDGNPSNNRFDNLRLADVSQNQANGRRRVDNTSGFKGACRNGNKWVAYITSNKRRIHLGLFGSAEAAHAAYCRAAVQLNGEFARFA